MGRFNYFCSENWDIRDKFSSTTISKVYGLLLPSTMPFIDI